MTTRDPDDLRDARVDASWRAASREEPPAALDDAIRAAARREIGARPRAAETRTNVPESLRPERWWWPLAAAATIGAIAIGILQIGEPDHAGSPAVDKMTVSDTPALPEAKKKQDAVAPPDVETPRQQTTAKPAAAVAAPTAAPQSKTRERAASAPPPAPASAPAPKALRKDAAVPFPRDEGAASGAASLPAAAESQVAANAATTVPEAAQPFPADTGKRESEEAAIRDAAPAAGAVAPSPAPPAAPADASKPGFAERRLATAPPSSADSAARKANEAIGVTQASATKSPARALPTTKGQALAQTGSAYGGTADAVVDARAKTTPKLPVPDWIALIRKLRDEGRTNEAEKELAAFRSAHADHEQILPPDLRDWKPAAR